MDHTFAGVKHLMRIPRYVQVAFAGMMGLALIVAGLFWFGGRNASASLAMGDPATDALGQFDWATMTPTSLLASFTTSLQYITDATPFRMSSPSGVAVDAANNRMFVADSGSRVLVFDVDSGTGLPARAPSYVLGQADFTSVTSNRGVSLASAGAGGLNQITSLEYDSANQRLFVADTSNNRVLVFDVTAITNGENAVNVLGQANFTSGSANRGVGVATAGAGGLSLPRDLAYHSATGRLFVTDGGNNRALVFDVTAITDGESAVNVLGQANFTSGSANRGGTVASAGAGGLSGPMGVAHDATNNRLFAADGGNRRVLVFDVAAITDGESAVNVLGQSGFTTNTSSVTQAGMNNPHGVAYDDATGRLFSSDSNAHRVTVYDARLSGSGSQTLCSGASATTGIANGMNASCVIGQATFAASASATTQTGLNQPGSMAFEGDLLFLSESTNNRVMAYDVATLAQYSESATHVIGQIDASTSVPPSFTGSFTTAAATGIFRGSLVSPAGVVIDTVNHRLFASDTSGSRVLVYDLDSNDRIVDRIPDYVLGQADFLSVEMNRGGSAGQNTLSFPGGMAYDAANQRLFVSDGGNNRVLVYSVAAITNGENAVNVLGQADFTAGSGTVNQSTLGSTQDVAYDATNQRLFVTDDSRHRVLVFDVAAITDGENAAFVLGQANFTSSSANRGVGIATAGAGGMSTPTSVTYVPGSPNRLFVADRANNRILAFDVASITNGESAVNVLGQAGFTTASAAVTQTGTSAPVGTAYDPATGRLFVSENGSHRIAIYDVRPSGSASESACPGATSTTGIANGMIASCVLGQSTFTAGSANRGASVASAGAGGLRFPAGMEYNTATNGLIAADALNRRFLVFGQPAPTLDAIDPDAIAAGSADFELTATGSNFTADSVLVFDGEEIEPDSWDDDELVVTVPADLVETPGTVDVTVLDPEGGESNALEFVIENPVPVISTFSPTSVNVGHGAFTLTVNGSGFVDGVTTATFNGNSRTVTWVSASQITVAVLAGDVSTAGTYAVQVTNPGPGGGSDSEDYVVYNPTPVTSSLSPTSATATSGAFTLTVNGSNFVNGAIVKWDGSNRTTYFQNSGQLTADILAGDIASAGTASVTVINPAPVAAASNAQVFTINAAPPAPDADSLNPSSAEVGTSGPFEVTVTGTGFTTDSVVRFGCADASCDRDTEYVSDTEITAEFETGDLDLQGTFNVRVFTPTPGGGQSDPVSFQVVAPGALPTQVNAAVLSRLKAGEASVLTISFHIENNNNGGTTTVTFEEGFEVNGPPQDGLSSACFESFDYGVHDSGPYDGLHYASAVKGLCGGDVDLYLGGIAVTNPSDPGLYWIRWINDDEGEAVVAILDNDEITITAQVDPVITFDVGADTEDCDVDWASSAWSVPLGELATSAVSSSDVSGVPHICTKLSTNAAGGAVVTLRSLNGALESTAVPSDAIASDTATLTPGTEGYGLCFSSTSGHSGTDDPPFDGAEPVAQAPFDDACTTSSHEVGQLTGGTQSVWSVTGGTLNAFARLLVKASVSFDTPPHLDYGDVLTFIATATF